MSIVSIAEKDYGLNLKNKDHRNLVKLEQRKRNAQNKLIYFTKELKPEYEVNWHHVLLAKKIEDAMTGRIKRLLIKMPPQHGKSELGSIKAPAYFLGKYPTRRVMGASYNATLSKEFGRKVRNTLLDPVYNTIFPTAKLSDDSQSATSFHLKKVKIDGKEHEGGAYEASGVGGTFTGKGADFLLIDDPIKNFEEASSKLIRDKIWDWFLTTAMTRLSTNGSVIIIMTQWHCDDLSGRIEARNKEIQEGRGSKQEYYEVLSLPMISERDEIFRKEGEALWESRFPLTRAIAIRESTPNHHWISLYQQRAEADGGNIIQTEWWMYYKELPKTGIDKEKNPISRPIQLVQSWDTAFKDKKNSDRSVCQTWAEYDNGYYLIDCYVGKPKWPELVTQTHVLYNKYRPDIVIIEDKGSGQSLIQELESTGKIDLFGDTTGGLNKGDRLNHVLIAISSGNVYLPDPAINDVPWLADFLNECSSFPTGKHDDQIDAMSQALKYLRKGTPSIDLI